MSSESAIARVEHHAQAVAAASTDLRTAITEAVAGGAQKTKVAAAAGITRQTLDRWLGDAPASRSVPVLPVIREGCMVILEHLPADRAAWVLGRLDTDRVDAACRTLEYAMKAAPVQVMDRISAGDQAIMVRALRAVSEARRVHERDGDWPKRVRL